MVKPILSDMWESISGDGSFEMQEDGLHITGTNALVNTLSPLTNNGEIEITFEALHDYDGFDMGALFRAPVLLTIVHG